MQRHPQTQGRGVRAVLAGLAVAGLTFGAPLALAQPAVPVGMTKDELFGTVIKESRWAHLPIEVCWENPTPADAPYRNITRRAVEETWERASGAKFVGWDTCEATSGGIRITIADVGPHTKVVGRYLAGRPQGMVLNFTFGAWSPDCAQTRDYCVYAIAAHEFGHALGFTHEQNRPDAPPKCRELAQGSVGDYLVTKYDPDSIMNYCNPQWNGDGKLSRLDVEAAQWAYGQA